jgi:hypothetical protein
MIKRAMEDTDASSLLLTFKMIRRGDFPPGGSGVTLIGGDPRGDGVVWSVSLLRRFRGFAKMRALGQTRPTALGSFSARWWLWGSLAHR